MPAALPTPTGVVRFRLMFNLGVSVIYGCKFDQGYSAGPPSTADLVSLAGHIATLFSADIGMYLSADYSLVKVIAIDLANPDTVEGVSVVDNAGTLAGATVGLSQCVALTFLPDMRYRGSRPKAFLPLGVDASQSTGQTWSSAFRTDVEAAWGSFQTDVAGSVAGATVLGGQVGVFYTGPPYRVVTSPTTGRGRNFGTPRTPPLVKDILGVVANPKIASQRRRLGMPF